MASLPVCNPQIPYVGIIPGGFQPGRVLEIRGNVPPNAHRFSINLVCGPNMNNFSGDDIAFHFNPRFDENHIVRNSLQCRSWQQEESDGTCMPIQRGQKFEIMIACDSDQYRVAINGQHFTEFVHRLPLQRVTHISVKDDVWISQINIKGDQTIGGCCGGFNMDMKYLPISIVFGAANMAENCQSQMQTIREEIAALGSRIAVLEKQRGAGCAGLYEWRAACNGQIPSNAVEAGVDSCGSILYVARAKCNGNLIPGKISTRLKACYVAYGDKEHDMATYDVLCSDATATWVTNSNGALPAGAVQGGYTDSYDALYVARATVIGYVTPGYIQPSIQPTLCHVGICWKEHTFSTYEVLTLRN